MVFSVNHSSKYKERITVGQIPYYETQKISSKLRQYLIFQTVIKASNTSIKSTKIRRDVR